MYPTPLEGGESFWIGNIFLPPSKMREFFLSSPPDCFNKPRIAMIDKILERRALAVLLPHEKQRDIRRQQDERCSSLECPEWNLRGVVHADGQGRFDITTIVPAPYQIPTDGATGPLLAAAGWTAWRPAHLHVKVSAPGYRLITSQLYFDGGEYLHTDIASAVKPELILHPTPVVGQGLEVNYDFVLEAD